MRIALLLFVLLGIQVIFSENTAKSTCAVAGFVNEIDNDEWHDFRVGLGLNALLSQALYESGNFVMIEEKEFVKIHLDELRKKMWLDRKNEKMLDSAIGFINGAGAQFIVTGKVFYFGKPRTRAQVGPAHFASDEIEIKIEITLLNGANNKKITAVGTGKASTKAATALFTFHESGIDTEQSMIGTATREAIVSAVETVIKKTNKIR
jgi:curli biogenesis system outer membrane secretion channel CsgG